MTQDPDFATKPTLTGERAILRPFVDADTQALLAALGDPDVRILTGGVHDEAAARRPASPQEEKLAGEWYATRNDTDDRLDLAVVDRVSGACVGEAVLNQWDPGSQSCNFRILIGPAGQNRGLGMDRCVHRGVHNGPSSPPRDNSKKRAQPARPPAAFGGKGTVMVAEYTSGREC